MGRRDVTDASSRLREAREKAGFASASEAAKQNGWKTSSYIAHENGQNDLRASVAKTYAEAFGVAPEWLLFGDGEGDGASTGLEDGGFAQYLKDQRKRLGLSQAELAARVSVSQQTIAGWEGGKASPRGVSAVRLASVLGVDVAGMPLSSGIGDVIRQERTRRGWSMADLGERLGVTRSSVQQWEAGKTLPSTEMLSALAELLGVSMDSMMTSPGGTLEDARPPRAGQVDPVLQAVWEKMSATQRRKLVQIALIIAEDK